MLRPIIIRLLSGIFGYNHSQAEYVKWRMSDDGKRYYTAKEQAEFWEAFRKGDRDVVDVGIRDRQSRIDRLRRGAGLAVIFLVVLVSGCSGRYTIPDGIPDTSVHALTSGERTYVVTDMQVRVPGEGRRLLYGQWYIISSDMMKMHVRNQNDLITLLEQDLAVRNSTQVKRQLSLGLGVLAVIVVLVAGANLYTAKNRRDKSED